MTKTQTTTKTKSTKAPKLGLSDIEAALRAGTLRYIKSPGKLWKVRRDGVTAIKGKSYTIPVIVGFNTRLAITPATAKSFVVV